MVVGDLLSHLLPLHSEHCSPNRLLTEKISVPSNESEVGNACFKVDIQISDCRQQKIFEYWYYDTEVLTFRIFVANQKYFYLFQQFAIVVNVSYFCRQYVPEF